MAMVKASLYRVAFRIRPLSRDALAALVTVLKARLGAAEWT
jgi:hypothetical protein